ncbi:coiled-coil domain-containing protein 157 [Melanerpes formicivorus]|uniref:coiled-coil domain-containing protein 157 n=1 Tax=Melanerpes formicivorus TaxID=211600 RepID=UPI00358E0ECE
MAHLLGHRGCMESLRADLRDLQAAIGDLSSRAGTGAVRFRSWKFPNRVSCELDVGELLERYRYTDSDPEFTQHAHVVLLELVIDRLLLLLQSFTGYTENLLSRQAVAPAQAAGPSMSVGLTAKRYCCSMLKLGASYQKLLAEKAAAKESFPPQPTPQAESPEKKPLKCLGACTPDRDPLGSSLPRAAHSMADSSVPRPAPASSLGGCDTCASAQAGLREVGKAIASICQSQNIPSALSKLQVAEESTGRRTLSAVDVSHWASEQSKDLSRIRKHLQRLLQQLSPLKSELEEAEKQRDELRRQVEDFSCLLEAEKQTQEQQRKEAELSLAAKSREHSEVVARLEQDKAELQKGAALLEEQFSALKEELAAKQAALQELVPAGQAEAPAAALQQPGPGA